MYVTGYILIAMYNVTTSKKNYSINELYKEYISIIRGNAHDIFF